MRVITWNVNSVQSRQQHLLQLVHDRQPDVLLLQELKCEVGKFPFMLLEAEGYVCRTNCQKTYNGVAVLTKQASEVVNHNICTDEARYLEVISDGMRFICVYVPLGAEPDRFKRKLAFLSSLREYLADIKNEIIIVGGDFNVAVDPRDIYAPMPDSCCYAQAARDAIRKILNMGYYDPYRVLHPNSSNYSWWDYRGRGYENNFGMRLDYFLLSPAAVDAVKSCEILEQYRKLERPSDHAPVEVVLSKPHF